MKRMVLDASAVILFFEGRSGAEKIEEMLAEGVAGKAELFMSVVNWGEVYYSTWRTHGRDAARRAVAEISQLPIEVVNADSDLTKVAAELRAIHNLPYADCFAAALAKIRESQLATSDQDFAKVKSEIEILFL